VVTQAEALEPTTSAEQQVWRAGNAERMRSRAAVWASKELEDAHCQSIKGQCWDSHCQPLSLETQFCQVGVDELSSCSQEVVGNHLLPFLPTALPAVRVQLDSL